MGRRTEPRVADRRYVDAGGERDRRSEPGDPPAVRRAARIAHVLDDLVRIPGTRRRVGLDALLGLVPGLGDWVPLLVSLDLIVSAARLGAGPSVLVRMGVNVLLDAVAGSVPVLGDLFDLAWKANSRNLSLLRQHVRDADRTRRRSRWTVGAVLAGLCGVIAVGLWVAWRITWWFAGLL